MIISVEVENRILRIPSKQKKWGKTRLAKLPQALVSEVLLEAEVHINYQRVLLNERCFGFVTNSKTFIYKEGVWKEQA